MNFQPSGQNPFNTIHETLTNNSNSKTTLDPSLILSYNDPTCNNIFLYHIGSNHFTASSDQIRPDFAGVSSSVNPYYQSAPTPTSNLNNNNYPPPMHFSSTSPHRGDHAPILKSTFSCNGLLCLITRRTLPHGSARSEYNVRIINPITSECTELTPMKPDRFRPWVGFGFGFKPETDEPMVIRLSHTRSFRNNNNNKKNNNRHPECRPYHVNGSSANVVEFLSLRHADNGWRSVLVECHNIPWAATMKPVSLHGALHWMVHDLPKPDSSPSSDDRRHYNQYETDSDNDDNNVHGLNTSHIDYSSLLIARFDLGQSNLAKYSGPPVTGGPGGYDPNGPGPDLIELNGYLSMVVDMGYSMDIWMMKEYGVNESWAKHVSISLNFGSNPPHVLSVLGNGQVLILRSDQLLELYEPKTRSYKMFRITTVAKLPHIAVVQPSLTSPCVKSIAEEKKM